MIKKNKRLLFIIAAVLTGAIFSYEKERMMTLKKNDVPKKEKVESHLMRSVASVPAPLHTVSAPENKPSKEWKTNLEKTLKTQGGSEVKDIRIQKLSSFVWKQDNLLLNVESVLIRLDNLKGEETSFKAIVDAQTGKILQTWDQPVFDHVNPRENFGIKLDARHFE